MKADLEPRCITQEGSAPYPLEDIGATYCDECKEVCKLTGNRITPLGKVVSMRDYKLDKENKLRDEIIAQYNKD